jgi:DNA-binding Xre family transcriptional regulator
MVACDSAKELLAEIRKQMILNDIQIKDLAVTMHTSQQNISQFFKTGNPTCETLYNICNALDLQIYIGSKNKVK